MDLDGDGKMDILSGSWPGQLYFFRGEGGGKFAKPETLKNADGKEINLGSASTVFAADWNGDGKLDLLIGDQPGHVHLMLNEGTARQYSFKTSTRLAADDKMIQVGHGDSGPIAVDWDGDKKLDLIVGCGDGSVWFFKNVGTAKEPKLAAGEILVPPSKNQPDPEKTSSGCGMRAKVCVFDWNGDGKPDLLVGDLGWTRLNKEEMTEEDKKAVADAKAKLPAAQKEYEEALQEWQKLNNPPRKKETPEEKAAREEKLKAAQEKLNVVQKKLQDTSKKYSELFLLDRQGKLSEDEKKTLEELRKRLNTLQQEHNEIYTKEYMPVFQPPPDETPEQQKERLAKLKDAQEKFQKLATRFSELSQIANKFEQPQMGGSVWLFLRK